MSASEFSFFPWLPLILLLILCCLTSDQLNINVAAWWQGHRSALIGHSAGSHFDIWRQVRCVPVYSPWCRIPLNRRVMRLEVPNMSVLIKISRDHSCFKSSNQKRFISNIHGVSDISWARGGYMSLCGVILRATVHLLTYLFISLTSTCITVQRVMHCVKLHPVYTT